MKFLTISFAIVAIVSLFITGSYAFASGGSHHHHEGPPGPQGPPGIDGVDGVAGAVGVTSTSTTTLITEYKSEGTASAMAAGQCQFDWTHDLQGCVAGATYDGNDALAFQLGKRYKKVLLNGGVSYEAGQYSAAGAINWKFK